MDAQAWNRLAKDVVRGGVTCLVRGGCYAAGIIVVGKLFGLLP